MKVGFLAEQSGKAGEMLGPLDCRAKEAGFDKAGGGNVKGKALDCGSQVLELRSAHAEISRGDRIMRNFDERVRTGYTSPTRAQALSYGDCLNGVLW